MAYPLYDLTGHPLLSDPKNKYNGLANDGLRTATQALAEMLLELEAPALTAPDDVQQITYAIALQVQFQLEQGLSPNVLKSSNQSHPGVSTQYRDRYLHPGAAAIVARVTGKEAVRFTPPTFGV